MAKNSSGTLGTQDLIFRVAQPNDYQELSRWIVEISQKPEQHCLHSWSGDSAEALCRQLLIYLEESELCYVLAFLEDKLVGAMGSEYDQELGRGWLHGPHVITENWDTIALELFKRLLKEMPSLITTLDAYLNVENVRGRRFYSQQGFTARENFSYDYWLLPKDRVISDESRCGLVEKQHEASFLSLFHATFPTAYYSGERILQMIGRSHQVFIAAEGKEVLGFVVVSIDESGATGEIQFLGVREESRGQGHGKRLLLSAIDWLLESAGVSRVCLNVGEEVAHARSLYESVGFKLQSTGVGLKKT